MDAVIPGPLPLLSRSPTCTFRPPSPDRTHPRAEDKVAILLVHYRDGRRSMQLPQIARISSEHLPHSSVHRALSTEQNVSWVRIRSSPPASRSGLEPSTRF